MKTGVIILNYHSSDDTIRLYREIESFPGLRRLVVDNSSDSDEASRLRAAIPARDLLFASENLGYAGGNNLGIRTLTGIDTRFRPESRLPGSTGRALSDLSEPIGPGDPSDPSDQAEPSDPTKQAEPSNLPEPSDLPEPTDLSEPEDPGAPSDLDLVAILNPDISLDQNIFSILRGSFEKNTRLAAAGPRLCIRESDQVIYSDGGIFRQKSYLRPGHLNSGKRAVDVADDNRMVDYINGSFLVMRTEAIRQIGGFDEKFFLYFEEADWCRRALNQGWDLEVQTDAVAWQRVSPKEETFSYYFFRSWFLYLHHYDKKGIRPLFIHQMKKIKWLLQSKEIPLGRRLRLAKSRLHGVLRGALNW